MNKWELEFWESESGNRPVKDFLEELRTKDKLSYLNIYRKVEKLMRYEINDLLKIKILEKIGENLYEFKLTITKIEFRFFGRIDSVAGKLPVLCVAHVLKKKTNRLKNQDIETAKNRLNSKNNINI
jgi:phage-related protein